MKRNWLHSDEKLVPHPDQVCDFCELEIVGPPYRDEIEWFWRGFRSKRFCDEACADAYGEKFAW